MLRNALRVLLATALIAGLALGFPGCGLLASSSVKAPEPVACAVAALRPYVSDADALKILEESRAGKTDTADRLLANLTLEQSAALARALRACSPR